MTIQEYIIEYNTIRDDDNVLANVIPAHSYRKYFLANTHLLLLFAYDSHFISHTTAEVYSLFYFVY